MIFKYIILVSKFTREDPTQKKQAVPKRNEKPVMGNHTKKDFVKTNVVEADTLSNYFYYFYFKAKILSAPPKEKEEVNYLKKDDYGQVPEYLQTIKDTLEEEKKMEKLKLEEANKETTRELTKKEKVC